jgi:hypothetical protein
VRVCFRKEVVLMEVSGSPCTYRYQKNMLTDLAVCMFFFTFLLSYWKNLAEGFSFALGFGVVWISYLCSFLRLVQTSNARDWFNSLIRSVVVKWVIAFMLMGIILLVSKYFPYLRLSILYIFAGFVCSILFYRIRVVFGEVRNV